MYDRRVSNTNLELTRAYLASLESRDGSTLSYYAPDVVQQELPNRLAPNGAVRGLVELEASSERGKQTVAEERYEVQNLVASGDQVAAEVLWSARLNVAIGSTPAGGLMKAHLSMFITWRAGKIVSQRNYDCYEPF